MTENIARDCEHWIGAEHRRCRTGHGVRQYVTGFRCPAHAPAALAGKAEPPTGPGWPIYRGQS